MKKCLHVFLFIVVMPFIACDNPTASRSSSNIGVDKPPAPIISGMLSLTTNDSTRTQSRQLDWSAVSYNSISEQLKYEVAIGRDDESNGFDSGDVSNILSWREVPDGLIITNYQVVDGTDGFSLELHSDTDYYFSIRATDSLSQVSNILTSTSWRTLAIPLWYSSVANWLDASDATTLFQNSTCTTPATNNGDPIGCWGDKSGSGTNALDSPEGAPVNTTGDINGLNTVNFSGADGLLIANNAALNSSNGFNLFILMKHDGNASGQCIYRSRPNGSLGSRSGISFEMSTTNVYQNTIYEDVDGNSLNFSLLGTVPTATTIFNFRFGNAGTPFQILEDGEDTALVPNNTAGGSPSGAVTNDGLSVGYNKWDGGRNFHGQIGEIIFFTEDLALADEQIIEGYLACKWGRQGNLPIAHPYKTDCP